jgi:hypothetical protein
MNGGWRLEPPKLVVRIDSWPRQGLLDRIAEEFFVLLITRNSTCESRKTSRTDLTLEALSIEEAKS